MDDGAQHDQRSIIREEASIRRALQISCNDLFK